MAAGLGFKTFNTGEVLTAGDVNGYLMQGVLVFASAAARDAAITSPQEGQFAFTKDTNGLWYYDGAAWVSSGATGDIEGVTAGVGISGGGTSGTVTVTNSMATAITTSGDLIYGTGSGTFTRRGIGSTGNVLTVAGGVPTWAAPSGGGGASYTLLNAGGTSLSSSSTSITGISGYENLVIIVVSASSTNAYARVFVTINDSNTGGDYPSAAMVIEPASTYAPSILSDRADIGSDHIRLGVMSSNTSSTVSGTVRIDGGTTSGKKAFTSAGAASAAGGDAQAGYVFQGIYNGSATISSIQVKTNSGTFDGGTVYVYGSAV
jgi:hypothetical protein